MRTPRASLPRGGSNRAASFLEQAHAARANRLASGSSKASPSRGQERMVQFSKYRSVGQAAKSAAHEGVVARPMDKNLSDILERRRAEVQGGGTSVARLQRQGAADAGSTAADTSGTTATVADSGALTEEQKALLPEEMITEVINEVNSEQEAMQTGTSVTRLQNAKTAMGLKDPFHKPARPSGAADMEI